MGSLSNSLLIIVIVLAAFSNLVLGLYVLLGNSKKATNITFFLLSMLLSSWSFTNLLFEYTFAEGFLKATYFMGLFIVPIGYLWLNYLIRDKVGRIINIIASSELIIAAILSILIFYTNLIIGGNFGNSSFDIILGRYSFLLITYMLITISILLASIVNLYMTSGGRKKMQLKFVLFGVISFALLAALVSFVLPSFGFLQLSSLDSPSSLLLVGFSAYAITRHKLMDIRAVVSRSIGYILLIATLAVFYSGTVLGLEKVFFPQYYNQFNLAQGGLRTAISVIMVFLFQPLRRWITNATDKIFFRNAYNKDELLGELSNTLGSTIVLIEMLYKVSDILTEEMKVSRTLFALVKDENRLYTVQANGYKATPDVDPRDVLHITKDGLMVADELEDNSRHKSLLRQYDAAVAVPLKTDKEIVGVLFLGEKSSGDMYNQQDLSVLEIIAPEIAVAIENAKSYEEINRFNVTLRQEVKRATYRLKEKNTQLMELDKAKDEFISMASHQLRTPLTAIKGYLSMLLEGDAGDIKVSQYDFINEAYSGANRMVGLINDLLNVSRMETGRFFLEPKEVDIERVVEEEVKQLQNSAKAKGLYLKIEAKGKVPHIWADETKIRQVVMNFMDNAIYYTNTGGVTVVLSHDKDNFIYEVHDTGIGVPKAQQEHMFEKFFRADNARTARPDGTGLGIYLAKRVIADHGGEIIFSSVEGKGSVFGFKFPLKHKVETKPVSSPVPQAVVPTPTMSTVVEVAEKSTTENK